MKHLKGPWTAEVIDVGVGQAVIDLRFAKHEGEIDLNEAFKIGGDTARLIVMAPELLKVLEALVIKMHGSSIDTILNERRQSDQTEDSFDRAVDLLKKARGES